MNHLNENIIEIARESAEKLGFLLIDVSFRGDERNRIIEIYIDNETGINTDDCARLSDEINTIFEEKNLISSNYRLDVSSPGVDRPLKYLAQYKKHQSRKFEIVFSDMDEARKATGKLDHIEDNVLYFNINNVLTPIGYDKIKSAKVLISF